MHKLIDKLRKLKLIFQSTFSENFDEKTLIGKFCYWGIDPTSDSIHIGHLVNLILLKQLSNFGMNVIILLGDLTGEIGDPSFKSQIRKTIDKTEIDKNSTGIVNGIRKVLKNIDLEVIFVKNSEINNISLSEYLQIAKEFNIRDILRSKALINRESSDKPMYLNEVLYCTIQANDYFYLNKNNNCVLQVGGQDQWHNMLSGLTLIRKGKLEESHVLTTPLITNEKGEKIGKTENQHIFSINYPVESEFYIHQEVFNLSDYEVDQLKHCFEVLSIENMSIREELANKIVNTVCYKEASKVIKIAKLFTLSALESIDVEFLLTFENISPKALIRKLCGSHLTGAIIDQIIDSKLLSLNFKNINSITNFKENIKNGRNILKYKHYVFPFIVNK